MAISQRQELRQTQSLVMTPQLQQAIKLLQLTNLEITEFVEQEIERNPLLELVDPTRPERGDGPTETIAEDARGDDVDAASIVAKDSLPEKNEEPLDINYGEVYEDNSAAENDRFSSDASLWASTSHVGGLTDWDGDLMEQVVGNTVSLTDHLLEQLNADVGDAVDRLIGFHLIHMLNPSGYFTGEIEAVAEQVGCSVDRAESVLRLLQQFDPTGVFARDLKECLELQLRELDRLDPVMNKLLNNLDHLARQDQKALLSACEVDEEDLADMIAEIRRLNPRPGECFSTDIAQTLIPDVFVRQTRLGRWSVELNTETLPKVLVNRQYLSLVNLNGSSPGDKTYITDQLHSANWLVRSLEQRAQTILKVATELVQQQNEFLSKGIRHLRPLTLRDIAREIDMHESTVSRVTANKYIATPRGVFQMKYFFTAAISSSSGDGTMSAEAVRDRIRKLIDAESADRVLSDDKIVEILQSENIDIARRTVAKYREAMRIPSSVGRRRRLKAPALSAT